MKLLCALLLSVGLTVSASLASDWDEDTPKAPLGQTAQPGKDTVFVDENKQLKSIDRSGVLQGSATAVRTKTAALSSSVSQAEYAERLAAVQRIDADANGFLQTAITNVVTQPSTFRAFIEKNHPAFSFAANKNQDASILVVKGQWDDSSKPLHSLGLKFDVIKTKELAEHPLSKYKVIIVDCAGELPREAVQKVRDFVGWGGFLLTTDWALQNVLEPVFPGFVQWNHDNTEEAVTDAFIIDAESPLLTGLTGRRFTWKLDKMSQCVRILKPERVHIIARSSRLSLQDPQLRVLPEPLLAGALALEFTFGRGKILHLVGHFDNCSNSFRPLLLPDPAPGAGISLRQVLATNFLIEALTQKKADDKDSEKKI